MAIPFKQYGIANSRFGELTLEGTTSRGMKALRGACAKNFNVASLANTGSLTWETLPKKRGPMFLSFPIPSAEQMKIIRPRIRI